MLKKIKITLLLLCVMQCTFAQEPFSLQQCIDYAIAHNLEIMDSKITNGLRKVDLKIAQNEKLPDLNAYANLYSNFGQGQDVFGTTRRNDNLNGDLGLSANVLLYNHHKLRNEVKKADLFIGVSEAELAVIKRKITIKVMEGYLAIQLNREIARSVDSAVFYGTKQYEKALKTTQAGTTALTVQYEAQANLAREKQKGQKATQEVERAKLNLAQLIQIPDYRTFDVLALDADDQSIAVGYRVDEAIALSLENHPDLKRLKLLQKSNALDRKIIQSDLYPLIKGSAVLGSRYFNSLVTGNEAHFLPQVQDNFSQQVALTISIPIFNKGRVKNAVAKNDLALQQQDVQLQQQFTVISQELEKMYFDYRAFTDQLLASQEMVHSTKMALGFTTKSFDAGMSSIYDLNVSRNNYLNAESEMIQAKYNCLFVSKMIKYYVDEKF